MFMNEFCQKVMSEFDYSIWKIKFYCLKFSFEEFVVYDLEIVNNRCFSFSSIRAFLSFRWEEPRCLQHRRDGFLSNVGTGKTCADWLI